MAEEKAKGRPVRVWLDGCFDIMHYGHANALRQAKQLGDVLVAGIHPSSEIEKHKGLPVMTDEERLEVLRGNKWVDEIVTDAPYQTTVDKLRQHNIDFCVHGEDISTLADGTDSFSKVREAGMFRLIKRTDGVSTTDLLGRMLLMTRSHLSLADDDGQPSAPPDFVGRSGHFLASNRKIVQFSSHRTPNEGDKIIYTSGTFDLFHAGHVSFLKKAKELGDFLIVGVHSDKDVNLRQGANYPIMNVIERALNLLSCKYVDEVIIGAPFHVTAEVLQHLNVALVCHGRSPPDQLPGEPDPLALPKEKGIFVQLSSDFDLSTQTIIQRIIQRRLEYEARNVKNVNKQIQQQSSKPKEVPTEI